MKRWMLLSVICCIAALALTLTAAAEAPLLDEIAAEIEKEVKAPQVGELSFRVSEDRQTIYIDRPEISGTTDYTIAYNIYDSNSNPVNYFYSTEAHVAATPGYGGLFNVFVVVTDRTTRTVGRRNIGWHQLNWPYADQLTVSQATHQLSSNGKSIYIDRPEIRCRSGSVTVAYNIYDSESNPVNYFYSTQKRVAATPGYDGKFNVFVVVTDTVTGEQNVQNIGWQVLGNGPQPTEPQYVTWPVTVDHVIYNKVDGVVTITGHEKGRSASGKLILHSTVYGWPVKAVADKAFENCQALTGDLVIPEGVETIGAAAFSRLYSLRGKLTLPRSLRVIKAKGFYATCNMTGALVLPDGLEELGEMAFRECYSLSGGLVLPGSVKKIGASAFQGCSKLSGTLTISAGVEEIGADAFNWVIPNEYDDAIAAPGFQGALRIPDTVKKIGDHAFAHMTRITGVEINHEGVAFGNEVFMDCRGLTAVPSFVKQLEAIPDGMFRLCSSMAGSLTFSPQLKTIGSQAFLSCKALTGVAFPDSLQTIGSSAFYACEGLTGSLRVPGSIGESAFRGCINLNGTVTITGATVGDSAFYNCTALTGLVLEEGVKTIGDHAFYRLTGLTGQLILPSTLKVIKSSAFSGCTGFTGSLAFPGSITEIGSNAFSGCTGFTGALTLSGSIARVGYDAFWKCTGLTGDLTVQGKHCVIENQAFGGCTGMTGSILLSGVQKIGDYAFEGSGFSGTLSLGSELEVIGKKAFFGLRNLTGALTLPATVTTIGDEAFSGCRGFTGNLVIPDACTSIGSKAFYACAGLTGEVAIPPDCTVGSDAFWQTNLTLVFR